MHAACNTVCTMMWTDSKNRWEYAESCMHALIIDMNIKGGMKMIKL